VQVDLLKRFRPRSTTPICCAGTAVGMVDDPPPRGLAYFLHRRAALDTACERMIHAATATAARTTSPGILARLERLSPVRRHDRIA